ncbi:oligosaccharide flippase family protein [Bradyrhizobium sp. STM 3557]|uniref:oligosaccharide flippase family protein n=1 Tax=Bradyrhizobium sp. STM 3557 TaxID=578920 RepID=UPI003890728D
MTRNSDLRLIDAAATGEKLKGGFAPALGAAAINAIFAGDGRGQPLARSSIAALAVYVVGAGLTCVAQLVIARIIGPDSYGVYAYVLAWVTLLGYLSTLGFHVSLLRFVPTYQINDEWALVRGVIQYSQRGAAGTAITIVLIGICGIVALHRSLRPELALTFLLGMIMVPFLTLNFIGASVVRAFGGIIAALAPERIVRDGLLLVIVTAVFCGNLYRLDATLAMGATLLSSIAVLGLVRIFLRQLRPPAVNRASPAYTPGDWWRPTLPLTVIMICDNLMSRSAVIALGLVGNTRDAGIFALAFNMAALMSLPRMAVATAFAPTVSALFARGDRAGLQSLSAKAACLSLVGSACAAIPLLLLVHPLLAWFGHDFLAGVPIVAILVFGQVFAAACGPQQHLITMTGHERAGAAILAACAVSSFVGCVFMIRWFGMTGAAFATTGTLVGWNMAMGFFIHRGLRLMPGLAASFKARPRLWI